MAEPVGVNAAVRPLAPGVKTPALMSTQKLSDGVESADLAATRAEAKRIGLMGENRLETEAQALANCLTKRFGSLAMCTGLKRPVANSVGVDVVADNALKVPEK